MSEIKDGGPAFPIKSYCADASGALSGEVISHPGMTMRDYIAVHATESDLFPYAYEMIPCGFGGSAQRLKMPREQARYAYADAMLAAREKGQPT